MDGQEQAETVHGDVRIGSWYENPDRKSDTLIYSLIIFTLLFMLQKFIIKALFCITSTENKPTTHRNT